jgi:hypothetical protein
MRIVSPSELRQRVHRLKRAKIPSLDHERMFYHPPIWKW